MALPYADAFTFVGEDVWLSEFRLHPSHPSWNAARETTQAAFLVAFPRTAVAIRHEGRRETVVDPLSAVVYGPGQRYRRRLISPTGDDCTILAASRDLVADAVRSIEPAMDAETYRFPFTAAAVSRDAFSAVQRLRRGVERTSDARREAITEELYWLLQHIISSGYRSLRPERGRPSSGHIDLAEAIKEVLGRELAVTHSLAELSSRFAVSPFHLVRTFRSVTGRPVHAYRTELRLRASLPLIADGVRLADVAHELGFASHAHLTDRFARAYGTSPARWREMSKNMEARRGGHS
jgi:AraC family transcriptional regulator